MKEDFAGMGSEIDKKHNISLIIGVIAIVAGLFTMLSSFFIGMMMIAGGLLLLPQVKQAITAKIPSFDGKKLTITGGVLAATALFFNAGSSEPVETSQPLSAIDVNQGSKSIDVITEENTPIIDTPPVVSDDSISTNDDGTIDNPFGSTGVVAPAIIQASPEPTTTPYVEPEPVIEPEPAQEQYDTNSSIYEDEEDSYESCSGLPRTCGAMTSCAQAQKALACGNNRLDRDKDGTACDKMCG